LLFAEQTFQKQACILCNTLLPEQRTDPFLDLPKRRRPQRKRLFSRRCLRPRCSNHGCPWIQKLANKATVILGCFARIRVWQMKNITEALALCEEVIRDCKKLRSRELRQLIEDYVNAQKEILEALRRKVN